MRALLSTPMFVRLGAFALCLWIVSFAGCSPNSSSLANDIVSCAEDTDCPANYHCAVDDKCWRNGQDPTVDGSVPSRDGSVEGGGSCSQGLVSCGGTCIDPSSNLVNCGATAGCSVDAGTSGTVCPGGNVCAGGKCLLSCPTSLVECDGTCVDPESSLEYCGATAGCGVKSGSKGTTCASGQVCSAGKCALSCQAGLVDCDGTCFDPKSSLRYCGATAGCGTDDGGNGSAGVACASGQVCSGGTCATSCQAGLVNCDGVCVDPESNSFYCGATAGCGANDAGSPGAACASGQVCSAGTCSLSCQAGLVNCNGECIDPTSDPTYCGATIGCGADGGVPGTTCASGQVCSAGSCGTSCQAGLVNCNGTCIDPTSDLTYCGASAGCGNDGGAPGTSCASGQVCSAGVCGLSCQAGLVNCNGKCIDPNSNLTYCGASSDCGGDGGTAGTTCASGQVCSAGACGLSCQSGLVTCNGTCVDPKSSTTYCGATNGCGNDGGTAGTTCASGQVCSDGNCALTCQAGLVNCNGTCVDPTSNPNYCGATNGCGGVDAGDGSVAGSVCVSGQVCNAGTCALTCQTGLLNCNGSCVDPNSSRKYCGATLGCGNDAGSAGTSCASGQVCNAGTCSLTCQAGLVNCNGTCIDPLSNGTYCGATNGCGADMVGFAGTTCASGQVCSGGACALSCQGGLVNCNGTCIDPLSSATYCGATAGCGVDGGVAGTTCTSGNVCSAGTCALSCQTGLVDCDGTCIDPNASNTHCGASGACGGDGGPDAGSPGVACPSGQLCSSGTCSLSCQSGLVNCNGTCIDPKSSLTYCGAASGCSVDAGTAGTTCASGQVCSAGACSLTCEAGFVNCNGTCIDPTTSRTYCGASGACDSDAGTAGTSCAAGKVCSGGSCSLTCQNGLINCNGTCVDPETDRTYCGANGGCGAADAGSAGTTCASGSICSGGSCQTSCPSGEIDCNDTCINPLTNRAHCNASGGCGADGGFVGTACASGYICSGGACQPSCPNSEISCGGTCIDPASSATNCGATAGCGVDGGSQGTSCGAGTACSDGGCSASCELPLIACGSCVDPRYDPAHCGGCSACPTSNSTAYCADTVCNIATCLNGYNDCDKVASNGCESNSLTDTQNCGTCGTVCGSDLPCVNGTCYAPGDGIDGPITVSGTSTVAGTDTHLQAAASSGATTISVVSASGIASRSKILLLAVRSTSGNAGLWEFANVVSVSGTTITLEDPIANAYPEPANTLVHTVPQYTDVTINGSLVAPTWSSASLTGGIVAFFATGTVTINGTISAAGTGYAGGIGNNFDPGSLEYKTQGESYTGLGSTDDSTNAANAGGGNGGAKIGGCEGSGGGGGGYAATGGTGGPYAGGCGYGGYGGGVGGSAYGDASLDRIYFGSGGGSGGYTTSSSQGLGGNGGGIVIIIADTIDIVGDIDASGGAGTVEYGDYGSGGGGAGGSVYLGYTTSISGGSSVYVNGGLGASANGRSETGGNGSVGRVVEASYP